MATEHAEESGTAALDGMGYTEVSMETEVLSDNVVRETGSEVAVDTIQLSSDGTAPITVSQGDLPAAEASSSEVMDTAPSVGPPEPTHTAPVDLAAERGKEISIGSTTVDGSGEGESQVSYPVEELPGVDVQEQDDSSIGSSLSASPTSSQQYSPALQESIVAFAEQYSLSLASKRFKVPIATIKKWMKAGRAPMNPKYNSPGQGRKISYSAELEQTMADHVRNLIAKGERVSTQSVRSYARSKVQEEVPQFAASTGWAQRFLARNNIDLLEAQKDQPPQKEPKVTSDTRGRPLSYSIETDQAIANFVRQKLAKGHAITNSELRRYAKELITKENPNFTGSASWAQNFLLRHKLNLQSTESRDVSSSSSSTAIRPDSTSPPSTSLLSTPPLLTTPPQFVSSSLASSTHLHPSIPSTVSVTDGPLGPATEIHVSSAASDYPNPNITDGVMQIPAEYASDDPMKQALAILTGENIDASILSAAQVATLQSTLSELTSDTVSLVDLLNTAQHLQEQAGESGAVALITHGLDSPGTGLYLGIGNSDGFGSGLTGAAATQVNPNTQAPTTPQLPRMMATTSQEPETNPSSRPLSYAKETDQLLAKWVQEQQAAGKKVTFASLRAYAKKLVSSENPNFNASVGWVTPFLLRHGLDLSVNKKKTSRKTSTPRRIESQEEGEDQLSEEPLDISEQSSSVQHISAEEEHITPEQLMVPMQVDTPVSSAPQPPPVSSAPCPPDLEGIRAILDQGMQGIQSLEPHAQQIQFTNFQGSSSLSSIAQTSARSTQEGPPIPPVAQASAPLDQQTLEMQQDVVGSGEGQILSGGEEVRGTPVSSATKPKVSSSQKSKGRRTRHTLSEKLEVVKLMREHSLAPHYVCRLLGIANSTLAGWIKLVQQKGAELEALSLNKKRSNLSGQGRPLTYSKEKDEAIAQWVQSQQKMGVQVMPAELAKHAQSLIREENKNFTASSGWAQKFLQRHGLQLAVKNTSSGVSSSAGGIAGSKASPTIVEDQHEIPAAVQTEEVIAHEYSYEKPYSEETEKQLVSWVREKLKEDITLSVQALCRHAEEVVVQQNPMFVASLGWAFMFLYSHGLMLDPKPNKGSPPCTPLLRKRTNTSESSDHASVGLGSTPKKLRPDVVPDLSVSPSTGNLCEALLALSNQAQESGQAPNSSSVQAVLQVALQALQQQQQQQQQHGGQVDVGGEGGGEEGEVGMGEEGSSGARSVREIGGEGEAVAGEMGEEEGTRQEKEATGTPQMTVSDKDHNSSNTYFGKPAREFSVEEKEEVVRYANATTLQKAAIKYGVAAPTVWRWRVELKLHQPKYSAMQKKYIIKFAETNSLKEAAQRYGITGKTIQNWRKALQADGELTGDIGLLTQGDIIESASQEHQGSEVVTYDNQNFQFIVDGGEVVEMGGATGSGGGGRGEGGGAEVGGGMGSDQPATHVHVANVPLEVTSEVDIENVGMEYDVISSEGHVAKPRCTPQEKMQILQYALDHSIKEASQKFGVSPGTLYYWKRMRNSGKESGKGASSSTVEGSLEAIRGAIPEMTVQYTGLSGEADVLDPATASQESVVIQPEQFIATTAAGTSIPTDSAAALQSLSQALAGMGPEALQQLPDLSLLQAVSSLLAGGAGEENKAGPGKRRDSSSEGISSPTEVLVQPFPTQPPVSSTHGEGEGGEGEGEGEGVGETLTPQMVTEEVVTIGENSEVQLQEDQNSVTVHTPTEASGAHIGLPSSDTLTPLEPVTAVAVTALPKGTSSNLMTPPDPPTPQDQPGMGTTMELEVLTMPAESSLSDPSPPANQLQEMECGEVEHTVTEIPHTVDAVVDDSSEPVEPEQ